MSLNNNSLGLGFSIEVQDRASAPIAAVQRSLDSLSGKATEAGKRLGSGLSLVGSRALQGFGRDMRLAGMGLLSMSIAGSEFEQQVAAVGSITGASTEKLKDLRESAIQAGLATKFSPDESIAGLKKLATAGLSADSAMKTLKPSLQLATAAEIDVADAAKAIAASMNSFSAQGLSADQIMDKLTKTLNETNFQGADFASGLANVAGQAGLFNQTLDTTLVGLGMLRSRNIGASKAATGMREAIRRVASDSGAMHKVQERGIKIYDESTGKMRNIIDIMFELKESLKGVAGAEANPILKDIFGARGLNAFGAITEGTIERTIEGEKVMMKGAEAVAFLRKELENSKGTTERFESAILGTFAGQLQLIRGIKETMEVELGTVLADVLKPLVIWIRNFSKSFTAAFSALTPGVKKFIGALTLGVAAILIVGGALLGLVATIGILMFALSTLGISLGAAVVVFGQFLGITAGVAAGMFLLTKAFDNNFGGLKDIFKEIGVLTNGLLTIFSTNGELTEELSSGDHKGMRKLVIGIFALTERIKIMVKSIGDTVKSTWDSIGEVTQNLVDQLAMLGKELHEKLVKPFGDFFDKFSGSDIENFKAFGAFLGGTFMVFISGLIGYVGALTKAFMNFLLMIVDVKNMLVGLATVASGIVGVISSVFQNAFYGIKIMFWETIVLLGKLMSKLPKAMRPGWVDSFVDYAATEGESGVNVNMMKSNAVDKSLGKNSVKEVVSGASQVIGSGGSALLHAGSAVVNTASAPLQGVVAGMQTAVKLLAEARDKPVQVSVNVDGEKLMSTMDNKSRSSQARTFSINPALGD